MIKVIVNNGWYTFSITGHKYYSRDDEIKLHGKNKFVSYVKNLYSGNGSVSFKIDNFDKRTTEKFLIDC